MTFESYFADHLRLRRTRLRIYRRPGSFATDYRILRNYIRRYKTSGAEA
ncbi:MAG: YlcG family protein [Citrobacter freundii]|nr:YlcG family protein [Citrobacter freundii]MDU7723257.1 YlcG family protein [Citrobacter sp.]MDU1356039.1 YlcG family protein [Citrobacter freundii]MDU1699696.1 YlcG family protein [Citrobacter freundii]MDU1733889.1 YlcG family protein [Citrobacter freundii]MDU1815995.1 YlcG family protein [Citrobacter freundii]